MFSSLRVCISICAIKKIFCWFIKSLDECVAPSLRLRVTSVSPSLIGFCGRPGLPGRPGRWYYHYYYYRPKTSRRYRPALHVDMSSLCYFLLGLIVSLWSGKIEKNKRIQMTEWLSAVGPFNSAGQRCDYCPRPGVEPNRERVTLNYSVLSRSLSLVVLKRWRQVHRRPFVSPQTWKLGEDDFHFLRVSIKRCPAVTRLEKRVLLKRRAHEETSFTFCSLVQFCLE